MYDSIQDNQDQEGSRALLALSKPQDAQPAQTPELQRFFTNDK